MSAAHALLAALAASRSSTRRVAGPSSRLACALHAKVASRAHSPRATTPLMDMQMCAATPSPSNPAGSLCASRSSTAGRLSATRR
eukprot:6073371-Prymnesium_polylepis.1